MGDWEHGEWVWNLRWNRDLLDRERAQVQRLSALISNTRVIEGKQDGWRWKASLDNCFSVKTAYKVLSLSTNPINNRREEPEMATVWKAPAPTKAISTAWKVLRGRLATCDNLLKRQVAIQHSEALCVLCKSTMETIEHLFFSCQNTDEVWKDIVSWLGRQTAFHHQVKDHFNAFINLGNKDDKRFLLGVWICLIWCIWKGRNDCKFNKGRWSRERMVAEIKSRLWEWKSTFKLSPSSSDFRSWCLAPNLST